LLFLLLLSMAAEYLNAAPEVAYVGDALCRGCHPSEYASFKRTGMGRSMRLPDKTDEVGQASRQGTAPGIAYSTYTRNGKVFHMETGRDANGQEVFSEAHEVAYCVGSGDHGRSYLVWRGDSLFVSPLSYYASEKRWELSPGHDTGLYRGFNRPAGGLCVNCHAGLPQRLPGSWNRFRPPRPAGLAIGCERCHGPGQLHVAQRGSGPIATGTADRTIVNPAKLPDALRDDICNQCHLAGDARVMKPGKDDEDFRPGTPLDDVVAIFSVPAALKPAGFQALSHVGQLHLSRCWTASAGRLGCITCHNPHEEPRGAVAAAFFRTRCLSCHQTRRCTAAAARRQQTQPPDNCIACHMPRRDLSNIGHTALTDHRIPRSPESAPAGSIPAGKPALIRETPPGPTRANPALEDLRTMALAYAQAAQNYPAFGEEGFAVLEQAARALPGDPEVQTTYGLVLLIARPRERSAAETVLERAIKLGSPSMEARLRLAGLRLEEGRPDDAVPLCQDAIRISPYSSAAHLRLARAYGMLGDREKAVATLVKLLDLDPGNDTARGALDQERRRPR
jgi:hypothetical protein